MYSLGKEKIHFFLGDLQPFLLRVTELEIIWILRNNNLDFSEKLREKSRVKQVHVTGTDNCSRLFSEKYFSTVVKIYSKFVCLCYWLFIAQSTF